MPRRRPLPWPLPQEQDGSQRSRCSDRNSAGSDRQDGPESRWRISCPRARSVRFGPFARRRGALPLQRTSRRRGSPVPPDDRQVTPPDLRCKQGVEPHFKSVGQLCPCGSALLARRNGGRTLREVETMLSVVGHSRSYRLLSGWSTVSAGTLPDDGTARLVPSQSARPSGAISAMKARAPSDALASTR